jgi:hypothetical protein
VSRLVDQPKKRRIEQRMNLDIKAGNRQIRCELRNAKAAAGTTARESCVSSSTVAVPPCSSQSATEHDARESQDHKNRRHDESGPAGKWVWLGEQDQQDMNRHCRGEEASDKGDACHEVHAAERCTECHSSARRT